MKSINELWDLREENEWQEALEHYWQMPSVQRNIEIEKAMDNVTPEFVSKLDSVKWFGFLQLYFEWKFTESRWLGRELDYLASNGAEKLFQVKERLMALDQLDLADVRKCLKIVKSPLIVGLGYPGASGLIAVIFKKWFGTVDKFMVESLAEVESLPERQRVREIDAWLKVPRDWRESDAVLLIDIMRRKAEQLNGWFHNGRWTPRKIDMILWASRDGEACGG